MPEDGIFFGRWRLLPRTRTLVAGGERIVLGGRAIDILLSLIEAGGEVVARDTLIARAWPGRIVEEANLAVQISALRKAFGAEGAQVIVTVPGRGYRFGGSLQPSSARGRATAADAAAGWSSRGPSLAVLPFVDLGSETGQSPVTDGIVENLITCLSRIRWFYVLPRNSAFSFRGRDVPHVAVGRELGVRYVVTGTVLHADRRIRANADLIETADGVQVWSDRFEHAADDVLALQDRMAASIVAALEPGLRRAELDRLRRRPTELPRAYEAYLRGIAHMHALTRENCAAALAAFEAAVEIDPGFALALAAAGYCRMWRVSQAIPEDSAAEAGEAIRLAEAALSQVRDDPQVLAQAAIVFAYLAHRLDAALSFARMAVDLHPNSAMTRSTAGWVHLYADQPEAAIPHFLEALRLDPIDPVAGESLTGLAYAHLSTGQAEAAVRWSERAIAASPERLSCHRAHVAALGAAGQPAETAAAHLLALDPNFDLSGFTRLHARRAGSRLLHVVTEGLRRAGIPEGPRSAPRPALRVVRTG